MPGRPVTIVGGGRDAWSDWRRGSREKLWARGAYPAWSSGPSTSPLGAPMTQTYSVARVARYSALWFVATFAAGFGYRLGLALLGIPFASVGSTHPFWHNASYAAVGCSAALLVYWLLARRHPATYWYEATSVCVVGNLIGWCVLALIQPDWHHAMGWRYVERALLTECVLISVAAVLSRRVQIGPVLSAASQGAPNNRWRGP